jgi:hypothetical protein
MHYFLHRKYLLIWAATCQLLTLLCYSTATAAPGEVNSINNGRDIQPGTYFNTPGSRTTFQNNNGGLWLRSGNLLRGLESNPSRVPTGHGGTFYFRAPNNLIRLDGTVDVSAVRNGSIYTGNGGKVFIDSAYLFQNGNIFANGANGGLVQMNVGGLTLGNNARISAQGFGGNGGAINIQSTGTVDLRSGSILDTSGKVMGTVDTNLINIEGSAINNQGIIRANGVASDLKPDNGDSTVMRANPQLANNPVPRPISAGNGTGDTSMPNVLFATPASVDFRGGIVRLVAAGQTLPTNTVVSSTDPQMLSTDEKNALNGRNAQIVQFSEGDVFNRGTIQADGALGKNGGTVILASARNVVNGGAIRANGNNVPNGFFDANGNGPNGGNGGTIAISALGNINNAGLIEANGGQGGRAQSRSLSTGNGQNATVNINAIGGRGGEGGVIAFNYTGMNNSNTIRANGGRGGEGGFATATDFENATPSNINPVSRATANAGIGGQGGRGGLILFSGNNNPTGGGLVEANGGQGGNGGNARAEATASSSMGVPVADAQGSGGQGGSGGIAGTIVAPAPGTFANTQAFSTRAGGVGGRGSLALRETIARGGMAPITTESTTPFSPGTVVTGNNNPILATRRNEYIRHEDVGLLFSQQLGSGNASTTLTGRLGEAAIRTVNNPIGTLGGTLENAQSSIHFIVSNTAPLAFQTDITNSNVDPRFFNLSSLTIANNGNFTNNMLWTPGVHLVGAGFHDMVFAPGGGHISWLVNGNITNNQIVMTRGLWSGGSIHAAATQDIINNNDFINIAPNKALLSGFNATGPIFDASHSGGLTLKAGRDLANVGAGKMASNLIFFDIHPALNQNPPIAWPRFLNGAQIGATVNVLAGRNLINNSIIRADALTYRSGQFALDNPALTIGGIVNGRARTGGITNNGAITAAGDAFFSPNESDGPRFNVNNFPRATSFGGTVNLR